MIIYKVVEKIGKNKFKSATVGEELSLIYESNKLTKLSELQIKNRLYISGFRDIKMAERYFPTINPKQYPIIKCEAVVIKINIAKPEECPPFKFPSETIFCTEIAPIKQVGYTMGITYPMDRISRKTAHWIALMKNNNQIIPNPKGTTANASEKHG